MRLFLAVSISVATLLALGLAQAQDRRDPARAQGKRQGKGQEKGKSRAGQPGQDSAKLDVPPHAVDLILGRPTADSVTLSVLTYQDFEGKVAYGPPGGPLTQQTPARRFATGEPVEVLLSGLKPDTAYEYKFQAEGAGLAGGTFHTRRAAGRAFTFTITADSHLDDRVNPALYQQTLANALADAPDFHVDLGDTFMTEKHESRATAARQYLAQRYFFGLLGRSAPLFLVLGNHDGESPRGRGSADDDLAVWSNRTRKRYFPNPVPSTFYSGDTLTHPEAGLLQDYFAWEWGDALFVVLDPFWFTQRARGGRDNWKRSLGEEQYRWLARTLAASRATYKFIFIHHLVGGATPEGRGGAEAAAFFEWGGKNLDGTDGFRANRPGWPAPIHSLLVDHRVTAVFHGHDHLYVQQQLDGVIYQEVPQPGTRGNNAARNAAEYGYKSGVIHGSPGHIRVHVLPGQVSTEYVQAVLPEDERGDRRNGRVAHSYTILPKPRPPR